MTLFATLAGLAAGAIGGAGYHQASTLQEEVRRLKAAVATPARDDVLQEQVHRLEARVAFLELRDRVAPAAPPAPPPAAPSSPAPTASAETGPHHDNMSSLQDPRNREERQQRVVAVVNAYWREWGAKYGLTPSQTAALSAMQVDAARRKLDNQARMIDHEITQAEARADNQAATADVQRKARTLLTPEQFTRFEADKGAEWGSSYRRLREAHARDTGAAP